MSSSTTESQPQIRVLDFKPFSKGGSSLVGFAKVLFPSGMILNNVTIHSREGKAWASPPSAPMVGTDGVALTDRTTGKRRYHPLIEFCDDKTRWRWSHAVVSAFRHDFPGPLDPPAAAQEGGR